MAGVFHDSLGEGGESGRSPDPELDPKLEWMCVGQTGIDPDKRVRQHRDGITASRIAKRFHVGRRQDLEAEDPLRTAGEALTFEPY